MMLKSGKVAIAGLLMHTPKYLICSEVKTSEVKQYRIKGRRP